MRRHRDCAKAFRPVGGLPISQARGKAYRRMMSASSGRHIARRSSLRPTSATHQDRLNLKKLFLRISRGVSAIDYRDPEAVSEAAHLSMASDSRTFHLSAEPALNTAHRELFSAAQYDSFQHQTIVNTSRQVDALCERRHCNPEKFTRAFL